jgi:hypothetical protein
MAEVAPLLPFFQTFANMIPVNGATLSDSEHLLAAEIQTQNPSRNLTQINRTVSGPAARKLHEMIQNIFSCIDAIFTTRAPLANGKRITFLAVIRKKNT